MNQLLMEPRQALPDLMEGEPKELARNLMQNGYVPRGMTRSQLADYLAEGLDYDLVGAGYLRKTVTYDLDD